ncbi:MAG TPA: SpoIIE family protein phosphatase [Mycobacteriales bacterium]|nr:SpoIIE family protein phosphatase [Mycobacteriales bacterium]
MDGGFVPVQGAPSVAADPAEILRRAELRYATLAAVTALDEFRADAQGRLILDMPSWRGLTARDAGTLLGHGWLEDVHPEDRDRVRETWLRRCVPGLETFGCEFRICTDTARERTFVVRAAPVLAADGRVLEWVGATQDVTDERLAARRTAGLQNATLGYATALTVDDVAGATCAIGSRIGAAGTLMTVLDPAGRTLELVCSDGYPDELVEPYRTISLDSELLLARVARTQESVFVADPDAMAPLLAAEDVLAAMLKQGDRAWAVLPLVTKGEAFGTLSFSFHTPQHFDDEGERAFLLSLARQAAQALERAQLFEREADTARQLQQALLPTALPALPGLDVVARYQPASGSDVGGDWYDVLPLPDGKVAFVLGDVMGRGVRAASIMAQVRNALRGIALVDSHPAAVLTGLDAFMTSFEVEEIVTVVYLLLDPATGGVLTGNAGHLPPLMLRADGQVGVLKDGAGTPLGVPMERVACKGTTLGVGDLVVLCTDGLVEHRDRDIDEGLAQLERAALSRRTAPDLERAADEVLAELGAASDDDRSLLLVRCAPR